MNQSLYEEEEGWWLWHSDEPTSCSNSISVTNLSVQSVQKNKYKIWHTWSGRDARGIDSNRRQKQRTRAAKGSPLPSQGSTMNTSKSHKGAARPPRPKPSKKTGSAPPKNTGSTPPEGAARPPRPKPSKSWPAVGQRERVERDGRWLTGDVAFLSPLRDTCTVAYADGTEEAFVRVARLRPVAAREGFAVLAKAAPAPAGSAKTQAPPQQLRAAPPAPAPPKAVPGKASQPRASPAKAPSKASPLQNKAPAASKPANAKAPVTVPTEEQPAWARRGATGQVDCGHDWYDCTLVTLEKSGSWRVRHDDGAFENGVALKRLRGRAWFAAGSRARVAYQDRWHDCKVLAVSRDGTTCTVRYEDNGYAEEGVPVATRLRELRYADPVAPVPLPEPFKAVPAPKPVSLCSSDHDSPAADEAPPRKRPPGKALRARIPVDPAKIGMVIGKGGETIRGLIEEFGLKNANVDDAGAVLITGSDRDRMDACAAKIAEMTADRPPRVSGARRRAAPKAGPAPSPPKAKAAPVPARRPAAPAPVQDVPKPRKKGGVPPPPPAFVVAPRKTKPDIDLTGDDDTPRKAAPVPKTKQKPAAPHPPAGRTATLKPSQPEPTKPKPTKAGKATPVAAAASKEKRVPVPKVAKAPPTRAPAVAAAKDKVAPKPRPAPKAPKPKREPAAAAAPPPKKQAGKAAAAPKAPKGKPKAAATAPTPAPKPSPAKKAVAAAPATKARPAPSPPKAKAAPAPTKPSTEPKQTRESPNKASPPTPPKPAPLPTPTPAAPAPTRPSPDKPAAPPPKAAATPPRPRKPSFFPKPDAVAAPSAPTTPAADGELRWRESGTPRTESDGLVWPETPTPEPRPETQTTPKATAPTPERALAAPPTPPKPETAAPTPSSEPVVQQEAPPKLEPAAPPPPRPEPVAEKPPKAAAPTPERAPATPQTPPKPEPTVPPPTPAVPQETPPPTAEPPKTPPATPDARPAPAVPATLTPNQSRPHAHALETLKQAARGPDLEPLPSRRRLGPGSRLTPRRKASVDEPVVAPPALAMAPPAPVVRGALGRKVERFATASPPATPAPRPTAPNATTPVLLHYRRGADVTSNEMDLTEKWLGKPVAALKAAFAKRMSLDDTKLTATRADGTAISEALPIRDIIDGVDGSANVVFELRGDE